MVTRPGQFSLTGDMARRIGWKQHKTSSRFSRRVPRRSARRSNFPKLDRLAIALSDATTRGCGWNRNGVFTANTVPVRRVRSHSTPGDTIVGDFRRRVRRLRRDGAVQPLDFIAETRMGHRAVA